jgi:hypothetical protein
MTRKPRRETAAERDERGVDMIGRGPWYIGSDRWVCIENANHFHTSKLAARVHRAILWVVDRLS